MAGKYNKGYLDLRNKSIDTNRMLTPGSSVCWYGKGLPDLDDEPVLFNSNGLRLMRHNNQIAVHQDSTRKCTFWSKAGSDSNWLSPEVGSSLVKTGTPTYETGKFGNALIGATGNLWSGDISNYLSDNLRGTMECWVKFTTFSFSPGFIIWTVGSSTYPVIMIRQETNLIRFAAYITGGATYLSTTYSTSGMSTGTWYHLAFSWDGAGIPGAGGKTCIGWIDGVEVVSAITTFNATGFEDSQKLQIANSSSDTSQYIHGTVDNVKVHNYAKTDFSDREIEDAENFIEGDRGILLPGDNEYHHYAARVNRDRTYTLFLDGVEEYSSSIKIPEECFIDWEDELTPTHWWKFNEISGSVAYDSGNGASVNGTITNAVVNQVGKRGRSYLFGADNRSVDGSLSSSVYFNNVSMSCWVFRTAAVVDANATVIQIGRWDTGYGGIGLWVNSAANNVGYFIRQSDNNGTYGSYYTVIESNKWVHLVLTYEKIGPTRILRIYKNGVLDQEINPSYDVTGADRLRVGQRVNNTEYFPGNIDDCRWYFDRTLSQEEVWQLYNLTNNYFLPKPKLSIGEPIVGRVAKPYYHWPLNDRSGSKAREIVKGADGTMNSTVGMAVPGKHGGKAVRMSDGTNFGYFDCNDIDIPNLCTFSVWVNPTWVSAGGSDKVIFGKASCMYLYLYRHASYSSHFGIYFYIYNSSTPYSIGLTPPTYFLVPSGEWAHIVGVNDGTNLKLYVNGQLVGQNANGQSSIDDNSNDFRIGYAALTGSIVGKLQDARIYNFAITDGEARQLYNMGRTPLIEVSDLRFDYPALTDAEISEVAQYPTDNEKDRDAEHQLESAYPEIDLDDYFKPDHWWKLDEESGSTVYDTGVVGGQDLTASGLTVAQMGKMGRCWSSAGAGVAERSNSSIVLKGMQYTFACWAYLGGFDTSGQSTIFGAEDGASTANYKALHFVFDSNSGGKFRFDFTNDPIDYAVMPVAGVWYHMAVTHNASTLITKIYKDGVMVAEGVHTNGFIGTDLKIRLFDWQSLRTASMVGKLQDARLYMKILSGKDIESLYNYTKNYKRSE